MKKLLFFLVFQFFCGILFSQNMEYAQQIVDTLSSSYFEGRGVANDGEKKAAIYIAKEFKKLGIQPIDTSYFQQFKYPINTITGRLQVQLDDQLLKAGEDYLVAANSSGIKGEYHLVWYNKANLPNKKQLKQLVNRDFFKDKFIVIDDEGVDQENEEFQFLKLNVYGAAGVIFLEEKLTKHLSQTYEDYVILRIKRDQINRDFKTIELEVNQQFFRNYQSQNVIGLIKGSVEPDSIIIVSAHYDHLGKMGDEIYFPGANDNASGVSMLLNLAHHYTKKDSPSKTIVFIAFGAEESGILGSRYFIENPIINLENINFDINLDVIGTGSEGLMVVNGAIHEKAFNLLLQINEKNKYVVDIKKRGKAANSDHYWFTEKGIPAFFIYAMGGIAAYHDVFDVSKTLPLKDFDNSFRLIRDFIDEL